MGRLALPCYCYWYVGVGGAASALEPECVPEPPLEPDPMFGQGCEEDPAPGVGVLGVVLVLGVVVLGVVLVLGVVVLGVVVVAAATFDVLAALFAPLLAAEAPEIPASTPPAPSTPVTSTALILFARFIGLFSWS
jgi:hypothetical protein